MDEQRLRELLAGVREDSKIVQKIIDEIVEYYSRDLDDLIHRINVFIRDLRQGNVDEYSDTELELDIIQISTEMYTASRELAKLGGESDMAKLKRKEAFNDILSRLRGTAAEKKAKAEQLTLNEELLENIYKRAYDQLKLKLEKADSVYSALKKVFSKRMLELQVFQKEIRERLNISAEDNDDEREEDE